MFSVFNKIKRRRTRDFQIAASVTSLSLECTKDVCDQIAPAKKPSQIAQSADLYSAVTSGPVNRDERAATVDEHIYETIPPRRLVKADEREAEEREKQKVASLHVYQNLPHPITNKVPGLKKIAPPKPPRPSLLRKKNLAANQTKDLYSAVTSRPGNKDERAATVDEHIYETTPPRGLVKADEREAEEREKQKVASLHVYQNFPHPITNKVPGLKKIAPPKPPRLSLLRKKNLAANQTKENQYSTDLSAYVAEEMTTLTDEITSLHKVIVKLEGEMRQAMKMKDCKEELDGLTQDWLTLNDYRVELFTRKDVLEILDKQENVEQTCNILRWELRLLLQLQDWRKTAKHRAQEARLLDLLLLFEYRSRENC